MRYVQFAFVREGSTDEGLADHIQDLLVEAGVDEVLQQVRDYKGTTSEKLTAVLSEGIPFDAIFIHRDTDRDGHLAREKEIFSAAAALDHCPPVVPLTPSRMTEAWLLLDEAAIRAVAGKPSLNNALNLPPFGQIESLADPKARLKEALVAASGLHGRDLDRFSTPTSYSRQRGALLQRLDLDGRVRELDAFVRLLEDVEAFVQRRPRQKPRSA